MLIVLVFAAGLWGLGWLIKAPVQARLLMIGLLLVAVLTLQVVLPTGHPLREATGGSAAPWLLVVGGV